MTEMAGTNRGEIWEKDNDEWMVYDNEFGNDDDAGPTTAIREARSVFNTQNKNAGISAANLC